MFYEDGMIAAFERSITMYLDFESSRGCDDLPVEIRACASDEQWEMFCYNYDYYNLGYHPEDDDDDKTDPRLIQLSMVARYGLWWLVEHANN